MSLNVFNPRQKTIYRGINDPTFDATPYFMEAIECCETIYVPNGVFYVNLEPTKDFVIHGAGSGHSILRPFDESQPVINFQEPLPTWSYHSTLAHVMLESRTPKTGYGFSFGNPDPLLVSAGAPVFNNVKFWGVRFSGFEQGLTAPAGNIGSEFYSCSWYRNKYGIYFTDAKAAISHAGNKHVYAGELRENDIAIYISDSSAGVSIVFDNTIVQANSIGAFLDVTQPVMPVIFRNVWFEANGTKAASIGNIDIDIWNGATRTTDSVSQRTLFLRGDRTQYLFEGGRIADIDINGSDITLKSKDTWVEGDPAFAGADFTYAGTHNTVQLESPRTFRRLPSGPVYVKDFVYPRETFMDTRNSESRWWKTVHRNSDSEGYSDNIITSLPMDTATPIAGDLKATGAVVVDGLIRNSCNEFTGTFVAAGNSSILTGTAYTTPSLSVWYGCTFAVKVISGAISFLLGDVDLAKNSVIASEMSVEPDGTWYTIAAAARAIAVKPVALNVVAATAGFVQFRLADYQLLSFRDRAELEAFMLSRVFVNPT